MSSDERVAVSCRGCGRVYQVPPLEHDQLAKCRGCGCEFVIAASAVERRPVCRRSKDQSASEHYFSQGIAAKLGESSQARDQAERRSTRPAMVNALVVVIVIALGAGVYLSISPTKKEAWTPKESPPSEFLRRGRVAKLTAPRADFDFESISDLIDSIEPSIVQVESEDGIGSGFVLDPSGLIVTCHHCIKWAIKARVVFADDRMFDVVGVRAMRPGCDLVILQINTKEPLPALALTPSAPRKGEPLVAFGSPAGLSFTVSEGAVSAHRTVEEVSDIATRLRGGRGLYLANDCRLVQFTATAMPGHSGGPIVDFRGNVLGVTAFALPYQRRSFEFAISFAEIRSLSQELYAVPKPLSELWEEELHRLKGLIDGKSEVEDEEYVSQP